MNEIISKELLSLVLGKNITEIKYVELTNSIKCEYGKEWRDFITVNLDTLGRLCKEWCWIKHYNLISGRYLPNDKFFCDGETDFKNKCITIYADTELEATILATEWIAKEKGLL